MNRFPKIEASHANIGLDGARIGQWMTDVAVSDTAESLVAVRFRAVSKAYGHVVVLRDLSFDVTRGQKLAIIGPSGSGKTTLLRLLMTLDDFVKLRWMIAQAKERLDDIK